MRSRHVETNGQPSPCTVCKHPLPRDADAYLVVFTTVGPVYESLNCYISVPKALPICHRCFFSGNGRQQPSDADRVGTWTRLSGTQSSAETTCRRNCKVCARVMITGWRHGRCCSDAPNASAKATSPRSQAESPMHGLWQ
jgi:hypothetical protein